MACGNMVVKMLTQSQVGLEMVTIKDCLIQQ